MDFTDRHYKRTILKNMLKDLKENKIRGKEMEDIF